MDDGADVPANLADAIAAVHDLVMARRGARQYRSMAVVASFR
jgi:hypothetical protein